MKIIFAGTPVFAATALDALVQQHYEIVMVLTQPDRPAGRGMKLTPSAVKQFAQQHGIPLLQPVSLKTPDIQIQLKQLNADVMVVAAYGLILPQAVLTIPQYGCLNIHASLLPRWRGAAPIQRAILAGDQETGITIMQMDAGLDTGDILLQRSLSVTLEDTTQALHDKLAHLGSSCIIDVLSLLQQKQLKPLKQVESSATYAAKIIKTDAAIDWQKSAQQIDYMVRAFNPNPGAYTSLRGDILKIWQAKPSAEGKGKPGEIISIDSQSFTVACGTGSLQISTVQKPGGTKLNAAVYLSGNSLQLGEMLL
ncbi:MAG TPA: methionyl-tRNA formyltransferase [Nitrosomonas sp.]|nr:methionyl-tRNA formyltransferase [Nitrosomonas sp.]HQX12995.1 methionyl-tRNA formyltransferase [Nitrosomonas sp.]HRB32534.1 methionyl-tRNA formyltransferase [Nitrosomonas sp.]HRB46213.1 methionyl-tRNA formyltransferase [Nitrosomonas sp.]HRB78109.1 methionyl-tRNA formyltransferase [Nitrosomonas sp.]